MKDETPQIQSFVLRPSSFVGGGLDFSDSFSAGVSGSMLANSDTRSSVATIISTVLRSYYVAGAAPPGLRPPKFEHRNGAASSSFPFVLGKAWVAPRLLGVDAVAVSAGHFADGHVVCLGS